MEALKAAAECSEENMATNSRDTLQAHFDAFDVSEELGFLLEDPLVSLIVILFFLILRIPHLLLSFHKTRCSNKNRSVQYCTGRDILFTLEDYLPFYVVFI